MISPQSVCHHHLLFFFFFSSSYLFPEADVHSWCNPLSEALEWIKELNMRVHFKREYQTRRKSTAINDHIVLYIKAFRLKEAILVLYVFSYDLFIYFYNAANLSASLDVVKMSLKRRLC